MSGLFKCGSSEVEYVPDIIWNEDSCSFFRFQCENNGPDKKQFSVVNVLLCYTYKEQLTNHKMSS